MVSWFRRPPKEPSTAPTAVLGSLEMHKPWMRCSAHRKLNGTAGAFLAIMNTGPNDDRLVDASCPLAEGIELCGIKVVDADIEMRPLAGGLVLHAGNIITLKPRGYHLLLRGVKGPLTKGSTLPITLGFEKAGTVAVEFAIKEPGLVGEAILYEEHHRG